MDDDSKEEKDNEDKGITFFCILLKILVLENI